MNIESVGPLLTAVIAIIAGVLGALRFNRTDASAIVDQQSTVLDNMKSLNDELLEALDRCRTQAATNEKFRNDEKAAYELEIKALTAEVQMAQNEIALLRAAGKGTRSDD